MYNKRVFFKDFYREIKQNIVTFFFSFFSISWFVCLSVRLSVRLSVCVFTFEVPFKCLFAPTSWSWMSNIFRDSESLGKSNVKMWSQIWTFLFGSGLKSPNIKKCLILPYKTWWKPRFPMGYRPLFEGRIANFGIFLEVFVDFFSFSKKIRFLGNMVTWWKPRFQMD